MKRELPRVIMQPFDLVVTGLVRGALLVSRLLPARIVLPLTRALGTTIWLTKTSPPNRQWYLVTGQGVIASQKTQSEGWGKLIKFQKSDSPYDPAEHRL